MPSAHTISGRRRRKRLVVLALTAAAAVYLLWPLVWMTLSSFQTERALQSRPPVLVPTPGMATLDHYRFIFTGAVPRDAGVMLQAQYTMSGTTVLPSVRNSLSVSLFVTLANLVIGVPAAHAFARIPFPGARSMFMAVFATRLLPSISVVVPLFVILQRLDILDTQLALVIIYLATTLPFTLWLLRGYFAAIPKDIEEAARIDGTPWWKVLWAVVLPLARPGLLATAVFAFMQAYGEFLLALVLTQTMQSKTMPVVVASLASGMSASKGLVAAAAVLSFMPALLVALLFQKQLINGLTQRYR